MSAKRKGGKRSQRYPFPLPTTENPTPKQKHLASVTTVIGVKNKPWLGSWTARTVAAAAADQMHTTLEEIGKQVVSGTAYGDALEGMMAEGRIPNYEGKGFEGNEPFLAVRDAAQNYTNNRGRVGTAVHNLIHRAEVLKQDPQKVWDEIRATEHDRQWLNEETDPWLLPVREFITDHVEEILWGELKVYNTAHMYAGTPDLIARMKAFGDRPAGQIAVIDWKTGRKVDQDVALQLNAYAMCDGIKGQPTGTVEVDGQVIPVYDDGLHPTPPIDYGLVMHLKGDYTMDIYDVDVSDRWSEYFLNLLAVYRANLAGNRNNDQDRWYTKQHRIATKEANIAA